MSPVEEVDGIHEHGRHAATLRERAVDAA